jgi:hypothetical protein
LVDSENATDPATGRDFFLDVPDDLTDGEDVVFLLNLHGGGSIGAWQRRYFPAIDFKEKYRIVVATPSALTTQPFRMWTPEADDAHLTNIVELVFDKIGHRHIQAFWLVGHSQGGMNSNRLLCTPFFGDRADGWLSLSGGRIGPITLPETFFGSRPVSLPRFPTINGEAPRPGAAVPPTADISFIFETGEHECAHLPETSPWAERYGAGARVRLPDVVDDKPGYVYDTRRENNSTLAWGLKPRPGTAEIYVYPGARDGRVIADVVRKDKGHTEGLEPNVTEALVKMMVSAPGGKAHRIVTA